MVGATDQRQMVSGLQNDCMTLCINQNQDEPRPRNASKYFAVSIRCASSNYRISL